MLQGARVLIVEDEPFTALALAAAVEAAGGAVVGPAASVAAALDLMDEQDLSAAILDANLSDGEVTPVAAALIKRGVPIIVHSGTGVPDALLQLYPGIPLCMKPDAADAVVERLSLMTSGGSGCRGDGGRRTGSRRGRGRGA